MLSKKTQVLAETVKKLLSCNAHENLKNLLSKVHQADIAAVLGQLDAPSQALVFGLLKDAGQQAHVLSELNVTQAAALLEILGPQKGAEILGHVSPDDVADILEALPEELSDGILKRLKKEEAEEVEGLIAYPPTSAGGIMSPNVFSLPEDWTVAQAVEQIQQSSDVETVFYVYIVNAQLHLVGVLSLKKLILASPKSLLKEIMDKDPVRVRLDEDQEEVASTVSRYNYLSIPVVDDANRLAGVITVDDVIDVIKEEAAEDMLRLAGVDQLTARMPLFLVTLIGGLIASEVITAFSSTIARLSVLAGFIPLVLNMGSSIGTQSMTVMVSALMEQPGSLSQIGRVIWKEFRMALIVGLTYGLLLGLFTFLRYGSTGFSLPLAVGLSLALTMMIGVGIGSLIPILFQKSGFDPAITTGPFVTTLINIFCIWVYFALATHLISFNWV